MVNIRCQSYTTKNKPKPATRANKKETNEKRVQNLREQAINLATKIEIDQVEVNMLREKKYQMIIKSEKEEVKLQEWAQQQELKTTKEKGAIKKLPSKTYNIRN